MKYLSVCSGIEAATCAWHQLGFDPFAFAEIEKFPSQVLAHHYPQVPNFGDMSKFEEWPDATIDLLVGGTPCQSFSVAGLRKGLADPRGNLMLTYGAIARRYRPKWLVWENVPGVLSSNGGRDFGTFLGMLGQLGYGFAYRVLDAQYFGVAQRRRRVFVVGYLGDWRRAAAVLFEQDCMRGNPAPSREAGKDVAGTISARTKGGGGLGSDFEMAGGTVPTLARCDTTGEGKRQDYESCTIIAHSLRGEGFDASEDGTGRGTPLVPVAYAIQAGAIKENPDHGPDGIGVRSDNCAYTLEARAEVQAVAFAENSRAELRLEGGDGSRTGALSAGGGKPGQGTPMVAVSVSLRGREGGATAELGDEVGNCLRASGGGGDKAHVLAPVIGWSEELTAHHELAGTIQRGGAGGRHDGVMDSAMQVRRLTPVECERLQGFRDDYTLIPVRGKPAADGPRYKALGNSMAVPVMAWIGKRIAAVEEIHASMEVAA